MTKGRVTQPRRALAHKTNKGGVNTRLSQHKAKHKSTRGDSTRWGNNRSIHKTKGVTTRWDDNPFTRKEKQTNFYLSLNVCRPQVFHTIIVSFIITI